ncbi:hypothetical protein MUNTM_23770 [Mycobacterium sp. MUNTM1]
MREAEVAKFDFVLFDGGRAAGAASAALDPFTVAAYAAVRSSRIGLLVAADPLRYEPFNLARLVASLDHISGGRAGWYLASAPADAAQSRIREFVAVVRELWDSWADGAFIRDKASGRFVDPEKIRTIDHVGKHFRVRGPLNVARPPQGQPVLARAGGGRRSGSSPDWGRTALAFGRR